MTGLHVEPHELVRPDVIRNREQNAAVVVAASRVLCNPFNSLLCARTGTRTPHTTTQCSVQPRNHHQATNSSLVVVVRWFFSEAANCAKFNVIRSAVGRPIKLKGPTTYSHTTSSEALPATHADTYLVTVSILWRSLIVLPRQVSCCYGRLRPTMRLTASPPEVTFKASWYMVLVTLINC